jgi:hypothetical protein
VHRCVASVGGFDADRTSCLVDPLLKDRDRDLGCPRRLSWLLGGGTPGDPEEDDRGCRQRLAHAVTVASEQQRRSVVDRSAGKPMGF